MTKIGEIYKCEVCSNVVESISEGAGILVCCGEDMKKLEEVQAAPTDGHYANLEKIDETTYKVSLNHPMTKEHYIEMIEAVSNDNKCLKRKYFEADAAPEMSFCLQNSNKGEFYIRVYCNIHNVLVTKY